MTQNRRDDHSTEYGIWIREEESIDSSLGFITTNIDYVWQNYKLDGKPFMLKEEKRYGWFPKKYQIGVFRRLDTCCRTDTYYRGFHLIIFENTCPDDGRIWLDGDFVSQNDLLEFLRFEKSPDWYLSYFPDCDEMYTQATRLPPLAFDIAEQDPVTRGNIRGKLQRRHI